MCIIWTAYMCDVLRDYMCIIWTAYMFDVLRDYVYYNERLYV